MFEGAKARMLGLIKPQGVEARAPLLKPEEEIRIAPTNSFAEFVGSRREVFDRFSSAHQCLAAFEKQWDQRRILHNFVQERLALDITAASGQGRTLNPVQMLRLKTDYTYAIAMVFATFTESETGEAVTSRFAVGPNAIHNLPSRLRKEGESWIERLNTSGRAYQEQRTPLAFEHVIARDRALSTFREYIVTDPPRHFIDFSTFLTDDSFQEERERLVPFLAELGDTIFRAETAQKENVLAIAWNIYKAYIEQEKHQPTQERFITFLKVTPAESREFHWMQIVTAAMGKKDLSSDAVLQDDNVVTIYRLFQENNIWPPLIRDQYGLDLLDEGEFHRKRIGMALDQFRREAPPLKMSLVDFVIDEEGNIKIIEETTHPPSAEQVAKAQERKEKQPYRVGVRRKLFDNGPYVAIELSEEELDSYLRDRANKLAEGDERMVHDVKAMVESLRQMPTRLGTIILPNQRVSILDENIPVRRLDPRKRRRHGLKLIHPSSRALRVVYAVYNERGDEPYIILEDEGIFRHDKYERTFLR